MPTQEVVKLQFTARAILCRQNADNGMGGFVL
jgi:hypothetical protein